MREIYPYSCLKRGRWYYRITWSDGGKRRERFLPLDGVPGSHEFSESYWAIRSGKRVPEPPKRQTWRELVGAYKASRAFRKLAPSTKQVYLRVIERIIAKNADQPIRDLTRARLREVHAGLEATPRAADHYLQVIKLLYNFARRELEWRVDNPADGLALFGPQREMMPWPQWLQDAFVKACGEMGADRALLAFHLGVGTGQRPSDLVKMEWAHFDGEYMSVTQDKTEVRLDVFCPATLRRFLAGVPRQGRHLFPRTIATPITYSMLEKEFARVREALGEKAAAYSMHGWRYVAAVELAEAGASDAEIQAVTGHKGLEMVMKYRRRANQRKLSKQAQQLREGAGTNRGRKGKVGTAVGTAGNSKPGNSR